MNGYFSRLIEQSGIAVEPAIDPGSKVPAQPLNGPKERDAMLPTRVDQEELVEPQTEDPTEEPQATHTPGSIVEESTQSPAGQVLHREGPEAPHYPPEQQHRQQPALPERRELDARNSERNRHPENTRDSPERGDAVEGSTDTNRPGVSGREMLERDETIEGEIHRADERSSLGARASEEEPQARTTRERVWQNTLREVRGWVAESSVAHDEEGNRSVSRAMNATSIDTNASFVEEGVAASHPKPIAPSPREEAATQDLRLEIGTISVTVEEPQKELPRSSQRTETAEKKSAGNSERSRLSRHYVRVR